MGWSLPLGRLFGVPIKLHGTLAVLLGLVALLSSTEGAGLYPLLLIVLLFLSVLIHELGHALVAQRFGVRTREIVLLPIGGAALLDSAPRTPTHELLIALAGPIVSLSLAGVSALGSQLVDLSVLRDLTIVNLMLGLFNLLPAFPLDGGRILRAGLTRWMGQRRATRAAARLGRLLALAAFVFGLYEGDLLLALIGVFVFFAATTEERAALIRELVSSKRISDLLEPAPRVLGASFDLSETRRIFDDHPTLNALPVAFGEQVIGVIHRSAALALPHTPSDSELHALLDREIITHEGDAPLLELLDAMGKARCRAAVIVTAEGELRGTLTLARVLQELRAARDGEF